MFHGHISLLNSELEALGNTNTHFDIAMFISNFGAVTIDSTCAKMHDNL